MKKESKESFKIVTVGFRWGSLNCVCVHACIYITFHIYTYTYKNRWSRVRPEKLTGPQLVKNFPAFYRTQRFITAFTTARHVTAIHRTHSHPVSLKPIYAYFFQMVHFLQTSPSDPCMPRLAHVTYAPPTSIFLV